MSGRVMQFAYTDIEKLKELQREKEEVSKDFKKSLQRFHHFRISDKSKKIFLPITDLIGTSNLI